MPKLDEAEFCEALAKLVMSGESLKALPGYEKSETGAERGGILAACEFINRDSTVPCEPIDVEQYAEHSSTYFECHAYLRRRLARWLEPSSKYDAAAKDLAFAAVQLRPWTWRQRDDAKSLHSEGDAKFRRETKRLL